MANKHAKAKNLRARALVSLVAIIVVVAVCAYLGLCGFGKGTMINYLKPWGDAISLGLDLRGGVYTVYQAENNGDPDFDTKMESTVRASPRRPSPVRAATASAWRFRTCLTRTRS